MNHIILKTIGIYMNPIVDEEYYDLLIDNSVANKYVESNTMNRIFQVNPKHSLVLMPSSSFNMCAIGTFPYSFIPSLYILNSITTSDSNVSKVQSNPNFALFGQGVLVAVIDTGIDYRHPAFRNADGTTRILSLWDQTIDNGAPSDDFQYGTIFNKALINMALLDQEPLNIVPSVDDVGHGTMIAGIIGGTFSIENNFTSIVPQCEFIIVKLKPAKRLNKELMCVPEDKLCYQDTDLLAALDYVYTTAYNLNRPLSICIALGTSQGGHDGRNPLSGWLDFIEQTPRVGVSVAAGNEGNKRRHVFRTIISPFYEDVELNISEEDESFFFEIRGRSPFRLSLDILSPTGEAIKNIYPRLRECRKLNFIFTPCTVYINNIITEAGNGDQLILIRFQKSFSGLWIFRIFSIDEIETAFDAWLPAGNLISDNTFFLNSDPYTTVTSPGTAYSPLSITNFNTETSSIAVDSSRGFTRCAVVKPELAAPGQNIRAPIPNNSYSNLSGTGAAAAHSTGVTAMLLEWSVVKGNYSTITGLELKNLLIRGAQRQEGLEYPNRSWGYGVMDILGVFEKLV